MTQFKIGASQNAPLLLEHWKPVVGFEGYYEVSNVGTIRRVGKSKPLAGAITRKGYRMVQLHRPGIVKGVTVHGVVATHFIGPRPEGLLVNHLDGVKLNNRASNFEFTSSLENTRHAMRIGTYKPGTYQTNLSEDDILEIRRLLASGIYTTEIARRFKIHSSAVSRIQTGKVFANIGVVGKVVPNQGERHHLSVLKESDIIAIRSLRGKKKLREIAALYGISMTQVSDIQHRKSWKHIA